ncbi:MAG: Modulator of FtsH protease HflK [Lentisphaerae bacterium ADurb.Bin242]|nr:MAG: Modulator of FtsH protease HflK [Lentisphaerae bacterium ADurb.Bin242]
MENNRNRYDEMLGVPDGGQFSSGTAALLKLAKALFYLLTIGIGIMLVWFFTLGGFFIVDSTRESVLLLHFGKLKAQYNEGWYWVFPYPVNTIIKVPKSNQTIRSSTFMPADRKSLLERRNEGEGGASPQPLTPGKDSFLLTGDNSIIHTEWELVYRVANPSQYYTTCLTPARPLDPDEVVKGPDGESLGTRGATTLIKNLLDDAVIKVTARWNIKNILYDRTNDYINEVKVLLVKNLSDRQLGISVESLSLPVKRPPLLTIAAFDEAASAGTQAAIETENARAYAIETANSAKSESAEIIANAESYRKRVVAEVIADKVYFMKLLEEYNKNPESVLVSLYSTTLADSMAKVKDKFVIGLTPGSRQELRLKLNPEPVIKKNQDNTAKDQKP